MSTKASLKRLNFCNFKLKVLLNITRTINENLETQHLLSTYEHLLREELNIGKVLIYAFNKEWDIILKAGIEEADYIDISVTDDLLPITEIDITLSIDNPKLRSFDFVIPVFHSQKPLAYVLIGDFDEEREGISPSIKHLHFIQTLTNIIIVAIENKRLIEENMQQERMKKELEMASQMQAMLIPKEEDLKSNDHICLKSFYLPHFEVGGDYFDFNRISENEYFFCIADVSGKGMPAALLMSNFQANLNARIKSTPTLKDLIVELNTIVNKNSNSERFITMFLGKYNSLTQTIHYINAGHVPPLFYDSEKNILTDLKSGCIGIGMLDEIPSIKEGVIKVNKGSRLLCFTDGLTEIEKDGMPDYGLFVSKKMMTQYSDIETIIENLITELDINKSNPVLFDDVTILGIQFK